MSSEAWELTKEWRRIIVMDLLESVIPKAKRHAMPKKTIFDRAVKEYKRREEKFKEQYPFLQRHKDFFINVKTIAYYWPDVKDIWAQEGKFVPWNWNGVWLSHSKSQIEDMGHKHQRIINHSAERYNFRAELANKKRNTQLPAMTVQLALPAGAE